MKLVRALIATAVALAAAVAVQTAASAAPAHVNDCGACWQIVSR